MKKGTLSIASVTLGVGFAALISVLQIQIASTASGVATDPGVRSGAAGAGAALAGLTANEHSYFNVGLEDFEEAEDVPDGLGPRMNLDSCAGCHIQPAVGGSSPAVNPQIAFASKLGGTDRIPPFLSLNGPVREARFVRNPDGTADGGVHALFTVNGRQGAGACNLSVPDWGGQMANRNVVFRIPTPTFGAGLNRFLFEPENPTTMAQVQTRVHDALIDWEPRIDVIEVPVTPSAKSLSTVLIEITYRVRATNSVGNLVYPFYLGEGSSR
jgi:phage baseplate assembly protein W